MSASGEETKWLPQTSTGRLVLWGSVLAGVAMKAHVVFTDDGINWPDEIYQSFEPAHRLVFGHGLVAWEYLEGARTWAMPGFVAGWLWLGRLFGATSPLSYIPLVKLVFVVLSAVSAVGTYRLARVLGAGEVGSAVAGAAWSLCVLALYFSPRAMSENLSAPLIVWGVAWVLETPGRRRTWVLGASALGLATVVRLQSGVLCAAVLAVVMVQHRERLRDVLATLVAWALVFGVWDALAWHDLPSAKFGGLFHSAVVYFRVNILENRGAGWGTAPWTYFFVHLFRTMPGVAVAVALSAVLAARRAWGLWVIISAFVLLHLFVAHKELRFIIPVMPLACAFLGVAVEGWPSRPRAWAQWAVGVAVVLSAWNFRALTMGEVGSYPERAASSAWDDFGVVNRLLLAASAQPDVCGLRVDAAHLAWTGGITYLHAKAPLYMPGFPTQHGFFNYAIVRAGSGAQVIAAEGGWDLIKLGPTCVPDVNYSWRLP